MQDNSNHLESSKCWKGPADASREEKLFALGIWSKEISEGCKAPLPSHHLLLPEQAAFQQVWREASETKARNNRLGTSIQLGSKKIKKAPKTPLIFATKSSQECEYLRSASHPLYSWYVVKESSWEGAIVGFTEKTSNNAAKWSWSSGNSHSKSRM